MSAQETPPADELFADLDLPDIGAELMADAAAPERDDRWTIDDPTKAEWAMAKLAEAERKVAELTEQRNAQMERAQAWWARTVRDPQRTVGYMQAQLVDYAMRQRDAGKLTTILPSGEIPTRKGPDPCVDIDDEAALVAWALTNQPAIVTSTHKVGLTDLRTVAVIVGEKVLTADGEVIPGASIRPQGQPTATIKPY